MYDYNQLLDWITHYCIVFH